MGTLISVVAVGLSTVLLAAIVLLSLALAASLLGVVLVMAVRRLAAESPPVPSLSRGAP